MSYKIYIPTSIIKNNRVFDTKQKMICIGIISILLLAGLVSLSAVAKEEPNTNPLDRWAVSITGGRGIKISIMQETSLEYTFKFKFQVYDRSGVLVKEDNYIESFSDGAYTLTFTYTNYTCCQVRYGRVNVSIYIEDLPIPGYEELWVMSHGTFFYKFTWGYRHNTWPPQYP